MKLNTSSCSTRTIFIFIIILYCNNPILSQISDQCIGCICYGSTGCNRDIGCTEGGFCGPLLLTWGFWADAGKYVIRGTSPSDPKAYPQCANDMYCAAETLRSYMGKFGKDCNGDGIIDCDDYARIHKNGPGSCQDTNILLTKYYQEFKKCQQQIRSK